MSSPMRNTRSSRCISSRRASLSASRMRISVIAGLLRDVEAQRVQAGLGTRLGKGHCLIHGSFDAFGHLGEVVSVEQATFGHVQFERLNRVALPILFNLFLAAVQLTL